MSVWLICGGRDFRNARAFCAAMILLVNTRGRPQMIVHGGARGADRFAHLWSMGRGIRSVRVLADWRRYGRAAGFIRNQQMLDEHHPSLVIAFPGGPGTADMVRRSRSAKIEVIEVKVNADDTFTVITL